MFNGGRVEVRMCVFLSRATGYWFVIDAQNVSVVFGGQGINFVVTQQFCSRGRGAPRRWWVLRDASMPFLFFILRFFVTHGQGYPLSLRKIILLVLTIAYMYISLTCSFKI